eukprot:jgi/Mesvir1/24452/Mv21820-RA.1
MSAQVCSVSNICGVATATVAIATARVPRKAVTASLLANCSRDVLNKATKGKGDIAINSKDNSLGLGRAESAQGLRLLANSQSRRDNVRTALKSATVCSANASQSTKPAQLYFTPTSCGAASYISALKAGILGKSVEANLVDIRAHKVLSGPKKGEDYYAVNVKGNVPGLVLEDGTLLNEGSAVLQWLADQNAEAHLAPANGTTARYVLQSKLNYIASEVHSSCGPLFNPALTGEMRDAAAAKLKSKLDFLSKHEITPGKNYLVGNGFTVADAYLYIVLSWMPYLKVDLSAYPNLQAYFNNIASLDFVKAAHAEMQAVVTSA